MAVRSEMELFLTAQFIHSSSSTQVGIIVIIACRNVLRTISTFTSFQCHIMNAVQLISCRDKFTYRVENCEIMRLQQDTTL